MSETNHEEYKKQVEEMGKHLLDVISSVSNGDYNVDVNVPEDNEVFADLAVGLEFLIEDLRESNGKCPCSTRLTRCLLPSQTWRCPPDNSKPARPQGAT